MAFKHRKNLRSSFNIVLQQGGGLEPIACLVSKKSKGYGVRGMGYSVKRTVPLIPPRYIMEL